MLTKSRPRLLRFIVAAVVAALAAAASAAAFQALPPGGQVNDDRAAGIDPAKNVNGDDPTNADVVGGALVPGKPAVPWSVFRQQEDGTSQPHDQIFSRSFAGGAWLTRGNGTIGGRPSTSPAFSGSLNFDQGQDGEAPAIDFAGAGRAVPWATWYENTPGAGFGQNNIFASRFDGAQNKWIFAGQSRGTGGIGTVPVPSLNIHTDQSAENPSVAGGSAADATKPGPWVTWQETTTAPVSGKDQIFVSRPLGPGQPNCDGVTPAGVADGTGHVPAIGGFCFQQTGIGRVGAGSADPSLNVDPTRNGVEPDIAFTGKNAAGVQDGVPWVVWYEKDNTTPGISGLTHNNEMVFAAKGLADATPGRGGFNWTAVGNQNSALLDATGTNHFGGCAASDTLEAGCSLNKNANADAEDPRVASGTMNPINATVPWVAWDETLNGVKQVFVSRLVGGTHFELANNGAPISVGANDSTRPDITFSGNTPYVSWRENIGGGIEKGFYGHFVNPANPTFVLDESDVPLTPSTQADVREPISSGCTADPFNNDGQACQGNAVGTPFFLFTNGTNPRSLFADAYQPDTPTTGGASAVTNSSATVSGSVNPRGASVNVSFQFGTTTAYGQSTPAQKTGPDNTPDQFSAQLSGLPAGTTIHYRAVAVSDFGTFVGADQILRTQDAAGHTTVGNATVSGTTASVPVSCTGQAGATCRLKLALTATAKFEGRRLVALTARRHARIHHRVLVVGTTSVTLTSGQSRTVQIALNRFGRHLLAKRHHLKATLLVFQVLPNGHVVKVSSQTVTFKAPHKKHRR
jgi:hypothetical protein